MRLKLPVEIAFFHRWGLTENLLKSNPIWFSKIDKF